MNRAYRDVEPMTRDDALASLASEDPERKARALLSLAYFDPDWRWVQRTCLEAMRATAEPQVRAVAATCLGHLARIHRKIDRPEVIAALDALLDDPDPSMRAHAQDALDDIETFVPRA
jgi:vesicle coat complex subunit